MEGGKTSGSSSFTDDLFGNKNAGSGSSTSAFLASIFPPPPPKAKVKEYVHPSETQKKIDSGSEPWKAKTGASDKNAVVDEGQNKIKDASSYYQQKTVMPDNYNSSIYYGGQDIYSQPNTVQAPTFTTFGKEGEDDGSGHASRGNWWQGSLYY